MGGAREAMSFPLSRRRPCSSLAERIAPYSALSGDERTRRLLADPRVRQHLERIERRERIFAAIEHYAAMADEARRRLYDDPASSSR